MSSVQKTAKQVQEIINKEVSKATFEYMNIELAARRLEELFVAEGIDPYRYIVMELPKPSLKSNTGEKE